MFIGEKAISSTIFTLDDFKHIFRAFLAAAFQPEFYDVGNARFEKLHVIFNKFVSEMYAGKGSIIADDFIIVAGSISSISQLSINPSAFRYSERPSTAWRPAAQRKISGIT